VLRELSGTSWNVGAGMRVFTHSSSAQYITLVYAASLATGMRLIGRQCNNLNTNSALIKMRSIK